MTLLLLHKPVQQDCFSNAPQGGGKTQLVMEDDFDEQFGY